MDFVLYCQAHDIQKKKVGVNHNGELARRRCDHAQHQLKAKQTQIEIAQSEADLEAASMKTQLQPIPTVTETSQLQPSQLQQRPPSGLSLSLVAFGWRDSAATRLEKLKIHLEGKKRRFFVALEAVVL
jgi:hypothetical protein